MPSRSTAESNPRSRRFLDELIERELREPVDRFIADRVQPTARSTLDGYRARLDDLLRRGEPSNVIADACLDIVGLFKSAVQLATDQLRDDAETELQAAFEFAATIGVSGKLRAYIDQSIEHVFRSASMAAADEIRPILAAIMPVDGATGGHHRGSRSGSA